MRSLVKRAPTPVRWLVVDAGAITALDYSAARMLRELRDELAQSGIELIFARVSPYLRADMERHRIVTALGEARIFATLHEAVDSVRAPSQEDGLRRSGRVKRLGGVSACESAHGEAGGGAPGCGCDSARTRSAIARTSSSRSTRRCPRISSLTRARIASTSGRSTSIPSSLSLSTIV